MPRCASSAAIVPPCPENPACMERMCVEAPAAIWRVPESWLKPMPMAFSICSSFSPSTCPPVAAEEMKPNNCVANQPSAAVHSGMGMEMSSRVITSVPAATAVMRSRPERPPLRSPSAKAPGMVAMLQWPPPVSS